jgi:hypothetical protein
MITKIPEEQICQAFDAKMIFSPSVLKDFNAKDNCNVSCTAPAFVYIEGTHGKKFLCDYHYHYEIYMTREGYLNPGRTWKEVQQFIIDERERVKETFAKNVTTTETLGHKCSLINSFNPSTGCTAEATIKVKPIKIPVGKVTFTFIEDWNNISKSIFYCNFHFRRTYYRYYNNGMIYEDYHEIEADERSRMTFTIAEEASRLAYV